MKRRCIYCNTTRGISKFNKEIDLQLSADRLVKGSNGFYHKRCMQKKNITQIGKIRPRK